MGAGPQHRRPGGGGRVGQSAIAALHDSAQQPDDAAGGRAGKVGRVRSRQRRNISPPSRGGSAANCKRNSACPSASSTIPSAARRSRAGCRLETLRKGPWPQDKSTDITLAKADYDKRMAAMQPAMDKYLADKAAATQAKQTPPPFPAGWPGDFRGPSVLWNGMVAPLLKFRVRGVAWYQGESNAYVRCGRHLRGVAAGADRGLAHRLCAAGPAVHRFSRLRPTANRKPIRTSRAALR